MIPPLARAESVIPLALVFSLLSAPAQSPDELARQRAKDMEQQRKAPAAHFPGKAGVPLPNVELPPGVAAKDGELTLFAAFDQAGPEGVPLYLVNRTGESIDFPAQDDDIYVKLEFKSENGGWVRTQNHRYSSCGNSYVPVTLGAGRHLAFFGYLPSEGTAATVRYRIHPDRAITSNIGEGRFTVEDRAAASVDNMAARDIPGSLIAAMKSPGWLPDLGKIPPMKFIPALALLSRYAENGHYRRNAERYLKQLDASSSEAEQIRKTLDSKWPVEKDSLQLFELCLAAVSKRERPSTPTSWPVCQELAWGLIGELLEDADAMTATGKSVELARRAFKALPAALASDRDEEVTAAARLLSNSALTGEHVRNGALFKWVDSRNRTLARASARALSRRRQWESLADRAFALNPENQLIILKALATGGGDRDPYRGRRLRNPKGERETQFWSHCATKHPVKTVQTLDFASLAPGWNPFNRVVYQPLRNFLETESKLAESTPDQVDSIDDPSPMGQVTKFVGAWQFKKDAPIFRRLLKHPGYEKQETRDSKTGERIEVRRFPVRKEAMRVLRSMGIEVDENISFEERVPK